MELAILPGIALGLIAGVVGTLIELGVLFESGEGQARKTRDHLAVFALIVGTGIFGTGVPAFLIESFDERQRIAFSIAYILTAVVVFLVGLVGLAVYWYRTR